MEKILLTDTSNFIKQYKSDEFSESNKKKMLNIAIVNNINIDVLEFLLKKGCKLDDTSFHFLIYKYQTDKLSRIVKLLIKYNIKLTSKDLNIAVRSGKSNIVLDMLKYNVPPDINTLNNAFDSKLEKPLIKEIYDYCRLHNVAEIHRYPYSVDMTHFIITELKIPITMELMNSFEIIYYPNNNEIAKTKLIIIEFIKSLQCISAKCANAIVILPYNREEAFGKYLKSIATAHKITYFNAKIYILPAINEFILSSISNKNILDFMITYAYEITHHAYIRREDSIKFENRFLNKLKCFNDIFSKQTINDDLISNNTISLLYGIHNLHFIKLLIDTLEIDVYKFNKSDLMCIYHRHYPYYYDYNNMTISVDTYKSEFKKLCLPCRFASIDIDETLLPENCNDIINNTTDTINQLLTDSGRDIIVFINGSLSASLNTNDIICYDKEDLKKLIDDPDNKFYECTGELITGTNDKKLGKYTPEDSPYIKFYINMDGLNGFIHINDINHMLHCTSFCKIFYIIPKLNAYQGHQNSEQMMITHSISWQNAYGPLDQMNFIGANHCQYGSNILVYTFAICTDTEKCVKSLINPVAFKE